MNAAHIMFIGQCAPWIPPVSKKNTAYNAGQYYFKTNYNKFCVNQKTIENFIPSKHIKKVVLLNISEIVSKTKQKEK